MSPLLLPSSSAETCIPGHALQRGRSILCRYIEAAGSRCHGYPYALPVSDFMYPQRTGYEGRQRASLGVVHGEKGLRGIQYARRFVKDEAAMPNRGDKR